MLPTLLPNEEPEMGEFLLKHLRKKGMEVFVNSKVTQVTQIHDKVEVKIQSQTEETTKNVEKVLMAVGRRPNINRKHLEVLE